MPDLLPTNPNNSQTPLTPPPLPGDDLTPGSPPLVDTQPPSTPPVDPQQPATDSDFFAEFSGKFEQEFGISLGDFVQTTKFVQDNFGGVHQDYTSRYEKDSTDQLKQAWGEGVNYDEEYSRVNEAFQGMSESLQQQWLARGESITPGYAGVGAAIAIREALLQRDQLAQSNGQVPILDRNSAGGNGGKPTYKRSQLRDKRFLESEGITRADVTLAYQEGRVVDDINIS